MIINAELVATSWYWQSTSLGIKCSGYWYHGVVYTQVLLYEVKTTPTSIVCFGKRLLMSYRIFKPLENALFYINICSSVYESHFTPSL